MREFPSRNQNPNVRTVWGWPDRKYLVAVGLLAGAIVGGAAISRQKQGSFPPSQEALSRAVTPSPSLPFPVASAPSAGAGDFSGESPEANWNGLTSKDRLGRLLILEQPKTFSAQRVKEELKTAIFQAVIIDTLEYTEDIIDSVLITDIESLTRVVEEEKGNPLDDNEKRSLHNNLVYRTKDGRSIINYSALDPYLSGLQYGQKETILSKLQGQDLKMSLLASLIMREYMLRAQTTESIPITPIALSLPGIVTAEEKKGVPVVDFDRIVGFAFEKEDFAAPVILSARSAIAEYCSRQIAERMLGMAYIPTTPDFKNAADVVGFIIDDIERQGDTKITFADLLRYVTGTYSIEEFLVKLGSVGEGKFRSRKEVGLYFLQQIARAQSGKSPQEITEEIGALLS